MEGRFSLTILDEPRGTKLAGKEGGVEGKEGESITVGRGARGLAVYLSDFARKKSIPERNNIRPAPKRKHE